ncbi:hypothetical protein HPB49_017396 [Dermacentor silvarum]|uniref:Uncharacterized protein n=1 Tax=Dermacentor silvarum TaxID=543639 RepID=A0ACB8CAH0_DERSI|nr:hypothetical protein HPB49_017396 [Dermacentor silvarum]
MNVNYSETVVNYGIGVLVPPAVKLDQWRIKYHAGSRSGGGGESNRLRDQYASRKEQAKSVDYSPSSPQLQASSRSKSSDNVFEESSGGARGDLAALSLDSNTLKRMLDPLPPSSSSSPDQQQPPPAQQQHMHQVRASEGSAAAPAVGPFGAAWLDGAATPRPRTPLRVGKEAEPGAERGPGPGRRVAAVGPLPVRQPVLRHHAAQLEQRHQLGRRGQGGRRRRRRWRGLGRRRRERRRLGLATPRRQASHEESPTSKLLMEYETHLRNALARGMDAESYSLHTFEALLTQSMENVGTPGMASGLGGCRCCSSCDAIARLARVATEDLRPGLVSLSQHWARSAALRARADAYASFTTVFSAPGPASVIVCYRSASSVPPAEEEAESLSRFPSVPFRVALMREVHVELEAIRKEEQALKTHPNLHGFRGLLEQRLAASSGRPSSAGPSLSAGGSLSSRRSTLLSQAGTASSLSVESNHALFPQASLESTDSRVYLTSSEVRRFVPACS